MEDTYNAKLVDNIVKQYQKGADVATNKSQDKQNNNNNIQNKSQEKINNNKQNKSQEKINNNKRKYNSKQNNNNKNKEKKMPVITTTTTTTTRITDVLTWKYQDSDVSAKVGDIVHDDVH